MTVARVVRIIKAKSGMVADDKTNTFHFKTAADISTAGGSSAETAMIGWIDQFFNTSITSGTVRGFMAESTMAAQRSRYKVYNLDDDVPRIPSYEGDGANPTPVIAGIGLPSEVAVCLSYRGALTTGTNTRRTRGRIYIGPILSSAMEAETASGESRPILALRETLTQAANRLKDNAAADGYVWGVYSPTTRSGSFIDSESAFVPITHVWCDNAFDTQRRRGVKATTRVSMDV